MLLPLFLGVLLAASLPAAVLTGIDPTIINIGSGTSKSYLVVDESALSPTPLEFIYSYTYNSNSLLTGFNLLNQICSNTSLAISTTSYPGLGNALDSVSYGVNSLSSSNSPDYSTGTYWSYYVSGGLDGGAAPVLPSRWNYANNGMDARTLSPGSWDGWTISSYSASGSVTVDSLPSVSVSVVPEPAAFPLAILSLFSLLFFSKWKPDHRV